MKERGRDPRLKHQRHKRKIPETKTGAATVKSPEPGLGVHGLLRRD